VTPQRIQRQRTKGWRMPEDAVYVGRPSVYGNPWPIDGEMQPWLALALGQRGDRAGRVASAVIAYRWWLADDGSPFPVPAATPGPGDIEFASGATRHIADVPVAMGVLMLGAGGTIVVPARPDLAPLRGRDLVCWCPLDQPCHADVLLEVANG
jgi:hypothetical protein